MFCNRERYPFYTIKKYNPKILCKLTNGGRNMIRYPAQWMGGSGK